MVKKRKIMSNGKAKRKFYSAWYKRDYEKMMKLLSKYGWLNFYIPKSDNPYFKSLFSG